MKNKRFHSWAKGRRDFFLVWGPFGQWANRDDQSVLYNLGCFCEWHLRQTEEAWAKQRKTYFLQSDFLHQWVCWPESDWNSQSGISFTIGSYLLLNQSTGSARLVLSTQAGSGSRGYYQTTLSLSHHLPPVNLGQEIAPGSFCMPSWRLPLSYAPISAPVSHWPNR